ncbi:MAG: FAD binding domain-containing protein [Ardenticatenia bacterium]|nr:FAD binding domain-containing protein [Ardenticatenia bacterium]
MGLYEKYYAPRTLDEALNLLAEHAPRARLMAGGTDLLIELERRQRELEAVIDITRIPGLDTIEIDNQGHIHLGPLVTHNQVAASRLVVKRGFPLAQAAWSVGAPQIRNRGTVAGNVVTASPANDTIPALMALDARVTLRSAARGERTVALEAFFTGFREVDLAPDEMIVEIAFPALGHNRRGAFVKLGLRQAQAISVVNVAIVLVADTNASGGLCPPVWRARVALGSVAPTVIRARRAEEVLVGAELDEATVERAARLAAQEAGPITDIRATAEYRRHAVYVLVKRLLRALRDGREREGFPEQRVYLWDEPCHPTSPLPASPSGDEVQATVNGRPVTMHGVRGKTLLWALRERAGLVGVKEGCGEGECGACTVLLDGAAVMSCLVPAERAHGATIVTVEGVAQEERLHPVQAAFVAHDAVQCGYCTPGFIMSAVQLLRERPVPSPEEIRQAISGNLCRCTGYYKIVEAIEAAANQGRAGGRE